jgi:hypothetical protein
MLPLKLMFTRDDAPVVTAVAISVELPVADANRPEPPTILNVNVAISVVELAGTSHPATAARMTFPSTSVIVPVPVKLAPCKVTTEWNLPLPVVLENVPSIVAVVAVDAEATVRVPDATPLHGREGGGAVAADDEFVASRVTATTSALTAMISAIAASIVAKEC